MKSHEKKLKEKLNYALKEDTDAKLDKKEDKEKVLDLKECMKKNPKTSNPEELHPFEYAATDRRT